MADKYEDFDTSSMKQLEKQVLDLLDQLDEAWNYNLKQHLDMAEFGWSETTGEKALLYLRRKLEEQGTIRVVEERQGNNIRKKWVKE